MKKGLLILAGIVIIAFVVIQFFQPERNTFHLTGKDFIDPQQGIPCDIGKMIKTSCYDCHSNNTAYPWYGRVAPVSWLLSGHIADGKQELNFSDWGDLSSRKRINAMHDICEVITEGSMPLKGYTLIHRETRLSQSQIDRICQWTRDESQRLLEK
jgi:hypothetical protein